MSVPAWIEEGLAARPDLVIAAQRAYSLRAVDIDQPALIIPLHGRKTLDTGAAAVELGSGRYLMLHRPLRCTVQNIPEHGDYRAWCIGFPWRVIELARTLLDAHAPPPLPAATHSTGALGMLDAELRHVLALLCAGTPDQCALDHALLGVLLALHRHGDDQFRLAHDLSVAARIRLIVSAEPGRDWCSADFEERLHMSGATLRRRLADEETSLRIVLRDARLHHGLALLQTTRRPLHAVAAACGYRSVPSFARQFAARFGTPPQSISTLAPEPVRRRPAASVSVSRH
ncbi:AraC-like DNA-binding protein [Pseudoduganella flava]|uniref:AraC-like DNA-binding protein n=1 Tax=Pseudoduganella flava TaxID=871742 RepID=A0A562PWW6_9BURK|nr:helix-turn-helix transcriptional regulator [Pseudoduganella flava]QGZ39973.1 helix-turn-helix domain-containing protein [Pseudoduganella flava]TWI48914.1 AraC-like DNA-binding protein [Pseudoduganella flava]